MKKAYLNPDQCDRSPDCIIKQICPAQAIAQRTDLPETGYPVIDADGCTGCGRCEQFCPHGAVRLE